MPGLSPGTTRSTTAYPHKHIDNRKGRGPTNPATPLAVRPKCPAQAPHPRGAPSGPERGRLHCGAPAAERLAEALADHPAPKGVALIWWGRSTVAGQEVVDTKW